MYTFNQEIEAIKRLTLESETLFKKEATKLFNKAIRTMLKYPSI